MCVVRHIIVVQLATDTCHMIPTSVELKVREIGTPKIDDIVLCCYVSSLEKDKNEKTGTYKAVR